MNQVIVHPDPYWSHRAAAWIVDVLQRRLAAEPQRPVSVALAGGTTPASVYSYLALLAPLDFDWPRVFLFLSDERMVPLDHPESNYRLVREHLTAAAHLYPVNTGAPVEQAALEYEACIREVVPSPAGSDVPEFDLVLLGVGHDGHTASLFPGSPVLSEATRLTSPAAHPESGQARVTLTLPLIGAAQRVAFLVTGAAKADVMRRLLAPSPDSTLPAALAFRAAQNAVWLVSREAAAQLPAGLAGDREM